MRTIHKYVLNQAEARVSTYERARFIHATNQYGQITVWAEVNTMERECMRTLHVVPTGGDVPLRCQYVGTALLDSGRLVLHVYAEEEGA